MKSSLTSMLPIKNRLNSLLLVAACGLAAPALAVNNAWVSLGPDFNWSTAANWTNGIPGANHDVFFATNTMDVPNNVVSANISIQSLSLVNTNGSSPTSLQINPGVTLTISSNNTSSYSLMAGGAIPVVLVLNSRIDGADGTLRMVASNGIFSVRQSQATTTGSGSKHTLDMSGLGNFVGYLSRLYVAGDAGNRAAGALYLAKTNLVTLSYSSGPPLLLGNCGTGAAGGEMYLGWTNGFFTDTGMWVAYRRASDSKILFNSACYGGTAYFRNRVGNGRQSYWRIGDGSSQAYSGNAHNGSVDFTLGSVDALVSELVVGRTPNTAGAPSLPGGGAIGVLSYNSGNIDVNNVIIGYQMVDYSPRVEGTINVDGTATLKVNTGMQLGRFMKATTGNGISKAILNIGTQSGGGTVIVNGPITTSPSLESANQSEINLKSPTSSLFARNSVGPLLYLELGGGSLTLDLDGNPVAPVCVVSNLITSPGSKLQVQGGALTTGVITLIDYDTIYAGSPIDDLVLTMPSYLQGFLSNNTANTSIDLWITNKVTFVWNGDKSDNWDIGGTANFKDGTTSAAKFFSQGDIVQFDDTLTGSGNVVLTTALAPFQMLVANGAKNYTFTGPGSLTGTTGMTKNGNGTITIANTGNNDFAGAVAVNGGTLRLDGSADRLPVTSTVALADAAGVTFDLNGQNQSINSLSGGGLTGGNVSLGSGTLTITSDAAYNGVISGSGRLVKAGSGTLTLSQASTYAGGTAVQSAGTITVVNEAGAALGTGNIEIDGTLRLGNGASSGGIGSVVLTNNGSLVFNITNSLTFPNLIVGTGAITKAFTDNTITLASKNDFSGRTTISAGALRVTHPEALGAPDTLNSEYGTVVSSAVSANLELSGDVTLNETILFQAKTGTVLRNPGIRSVSGTNTLAGKLILVSASVHNFSAAAGAKLIIDGPIQASTNWLSGFPYHALDGDGEGVANSGFVNGSSFTGMTNSLFKLGNGTWTLNGNNTWIGHTVISNGTLIVNGSILGTNLVRVNAAGFHVGMIVSTNGTLKGDGLIHCITTNAGTLSPGSTIGTLTISNALTMLPDSTNIFEIGASAYDQVKGLSNVRYGGTLKVVLDRSLAGGEVFRLFEALTYEPSAFDTLELPTLPAGLTWNTDSLGVDGTLKVEGGAISFAQIARLSDGNFNLSGTSGMGSAGYRVMATTNVADEASWIQIGAGNFTSGAFSFSDLQATNFVQRFYKVVSP